MKRQEMYERKRGLCGNIGGDGCDAAAPLLI